MKENQIMQGRWYKIKDWVMDPKGYFLIAIDREKKILRVGYCIFRKLENKLINYM